MAVVKYGALITEIKGKVGGSVFQGGNGAKVMRNGSYKQGSSSVSKQASTSAISQVATLWRTLSPSQVLAWASAAETWQFVDKFGSIYYGSGYQVFIAWNKALLAMQLPIVLLPNAEEGFEPVSNFEVVNNTGQLLRVSFDAATSTNQIIDLFMTAPMGANRKNNNLKYYHVSNIESSAGHFFDITTDYINVFGNIPLGATIYWRTITRVNSYPRAVNPLTGSVLVSI